MPLALRFALRELRSGVAGFRIFLACLALGVAAIAAAGSTAEAFRAGLAAQGRELLGGDLRISVEDRRFTPAERAAFQKLGATVFSAGSRAMAQAQSGERRLVELRGVSPGYPLAGKVSLAGVKTLDEAFKPDGAAAGAAVEQTLIDRLGLKLGDHIVIGNSPFVVRAVLVSEPDRLSRGFALGARVLTRLSTLETDGFLQPGLPDQGETARIAFAPPGVGGPSAPDPVAKALTRQFPKAGLQIRGRDEAAAGIKNLIRQLEYFLGFIGLASLVAGGLGVAGAVSAYLEARKPSIAVLKALGAEGGLIRDVYLIQIAVLAALGVGIGLIIGAAAPLALGEIARNQLPIPALFAVYPWPLAKAALFGLLAAAAFSLAPLARARATPPAALFRRDLTGRLRFGPEIAVSVLAFLGLAGLAIVTAPTPVAAAIMIAGVAFAFVLLWALGWGAALGAAKVRLLARGSIRIGLANLAGPRSAAKTASPAIGLGVALLSAVVLIQSSLLAQVSQVAPKTAPAMVFTDIPGDQVQAFDAVVRQAFGQPLTSKNYLRAPFATGRIVKVRGQAVNLDKIKDSERWAYDNDIALSAIGPEPSEANIVEGRWWSADYAGPPLVAMEVQAAKGANLKVGDAITVSILGREIDAHVAALRKVDWGGFGPTFALIVNPAALAGADLRNVAIAKTGKAGEAAVTRALGRDFPTVNVISVREQLEAATDMFARLALAVRGAAGVAALAGLLVLAGAIAAGARARAREAATLKVLGASRGQVLMAYGVEYGAVGLIAGVAGVALGYAAAWPVVVKVFEAQWSVDWGGVAALVGGASGLAALGGLLAALQALSRRPAPVLRAE
ncbi:putative ABC transport system permease protein [Caulobacter ginsengisoli]|uniref:ABC transport system permease protein n=1 Tax=Caulobacter ginsengisoli TaxID=400775 RepID=A0ABU0IYQ6_9CAUL|nr:FtsX-like permease family protein [Caulobacter ginsengisoli]MDQ0466184.1 putative ABC transport system permease protein [Caulobacter ginsengisoli]